VRRQLCGVRFEFDQAAFELLSPGEQARALKALKRFRDRRLDNPLDAYDPHFRQVDYHSSIGNKWRMFAGGNRSGKTTGGILDDLIQAAPRELVPEHLLPYKRFDCPFYCRICTPDMKNTMLPVVIPKMREWVPLAMMKGGEFDASWDKSNWCFRFECGCRFDFQTYEQTLDKFGGAALHRVHFDEEPPEDIYKECLMRTIDFNGDLCFTMTPLQGMTWTFDGIWGKRHLDGYHVTVADMDENPYLSSEGRAAALSDLTAEEVDARKRGLFVHFGGLIYDTRVWHERLVDPPGREWVTDQEMIVVGIDPGIRNTGVAFEAFDRENRSLQFAELRCENMDVAQVVAEIERVQRGWGFHGRRNVVHVMDPAARARSPIDAVTLETEYANCGLPTVRGQNDVEAGVTMYRRRMRDKAAFVSRDCALTTWEAERYRIDNDAAKIGKFAVVKTDDHILDGKRYAQMYRPWNHRPSSPVPQRPGEDVAYPPRALASKVPAY
jgi:phage terminase large subunit-like protein